MYSHSLLLTNERLAQLTIANEQAKASGETEPSGGTLFCALAMRSLMRMLKMSPQCQQLELMAFASESKQHSETPEDICAFVCRNDLRDPAICEGQNKMKRVFLFMSVLFCSFSLSFSAALFVVYSTLVSSDVSIRDTDSHRHCLFVWHVGFSRHSIDGRPWFYTKMTHILSSVILFIYVF